MMFGKKKEEEYEYIGNVFDKDEYGKLIDEEDVPYENISDEYVEGLVTPCLSEDEEILCVINGGSKKLETSDSIPALKKFLKGFGIAGAVVVAFFVVGVLLATSGAVIGLLLCVPFVLFDVMLPFVIVTVIVIVFKCNRISKGLHYAVTNKRIIGYGYQFMKSVSLGDIRYTKAKVKKEKNNIGKITVSAVVYEEVKTYWVFTIPRVKDPLRVKYMIDQAIERYKAGGVRDD